MIASQNELFKTALALPADIRAALAKALIDSLPQEDAAAIDEAWQVEIQRRLADFEADPSSAIPAQDVFARFRGV
jgi:putative addiction module component (TIGR02574 family)